MKFVRYIFLSALLLIPAAVQAQDGYQRSEVLANYDEWLKCAADEECVITKARMCGYEFAVNKKYIDKAVAYVAVDCTKPYRHIPYGTAKCINDKCVLAYPSEPKNELDKSPSPQPALKESQ